MVIGDIQDPTSFRFFALDNAHANGFHDRDAEPFQLCAIRWIQNLLIPLSTDCCLHVSEQVEKAVCAGTRWMRQIQARKMPVTSVEKAYSQGHEPFIQFHIFERASHPGSVDANVRNRQFLFNSKSGGMPLSIAETASYA